MLEGNVSSDPHLIIQGFCKMLKIESFFLLLMIAVQSSIMVGKFATFLLVPRLETSEGHSITNCLNNRHGAGAFSQPRFRDLDDDFLAAKALEA